MHNRNLFMLAACTIISESMQRVVKAISELDREQVRAAIRAGDTIVLGVGPPHPVNMPFHLKFHNPHAFDLKDLIKEQPVMQDMVKYNKLKTQLHLATMRKDKHLIKQIEAQMRNCYA